MLSSILSIVAGLIKLVTDMLSRARERMLIAMGATQERAKRTEQDLAVAKKQGEIVAKQRSRDEIADSLDKGEF
jgi:hypothetical protein